MKKLARGSGYGERPEFGDFLNVLEDYFKTGAQRRNALAENLKVFITACLPRHQELQAKAMVFEKAFEASDPAVSDADIERFSGILNRYLSTNRRDFDAQRLFGLFMAHVPRFKDYNPSSRRVLAAG